MQNQQNFSNRQLTQEDTIRYFTSKKSVQYYAMVAANVIAIIISIILLTSGIVIFFDIIAILICILLLARRFVADYRGMRDRPTDEEYDNWLKVRSSNIVRGEVGNLGIHERDISDQTLFFQSYVLPGSQAGKHYPPEQLHIQKGQDGKIRSSVNVYTYLIPTRYSIGVIMFDINAFAHKNHSHIYMRNMPYAYNAVIRVNKSPIHDTVLYNRIRYNCRAEKLCFTIYDGATTEDIDITAAVQATFKVGEEFMTLAFTNRLDRKMNQLRQLLIKYRR